MVKYYNTFFTAFLFVLQKQGQERIMISENVQADVFCPVNGRDETENA